MENKENLKLKIGLEVHSYLSTKEKLFCECRAIRHATKKQILPNTQICPICTGYPGSKPMLPNAEALRKAIKIALILNCNTNIIENKKIEWERYRTHVSKYELDTYLSIL